MALDLIRTITSGPRRRFRDPHANLDLDLCYVVPRVIAMGYPAEGNEAAFRNPLSDVVRFFFMRHGDRQIRIFNLSERRYDETRFGPDVVVNKGFPDRHSCPLTLALDLAEEISEFLEKGPRKVAAVHCALHTRGARRAQQSQARCHAAAATR